MKTRKLHETIGNGNFINNKIENHNCVDKEQLWVMYNPVIRRCFIRKGHIVKTCLISVGFLFR